MRVLTHIDRLEIEELMARDEFFWLDLERPEQSDLELLREMFDIHPLAIEDTQKFGQRPKLDDYERYVFIVFFAVRSLADGETGLTEVHLFVSGSYVITIRREHCDELVGVRSRLERGPAGAEHFVVYRILDALTDSFFPVLSRIDDEIDALEEAVVMEPTDEQLKRIFHVKRNLVTLRRVVTPQRDLFARTIDQITMLPGLQAGPRDYFRDVYDHLIRISELIDSYRDLLSGMMDVYLSTVSNRLNQIMKQLTVISTVFLPLMFVTGFFGQNFGWLVDHVDTFAAFAAFGLGGVLVPLALLFAWFRRSGYL